MKAYFGGKFPFVYREFSMENLSWDYRASLIGVENLVKQPPVLPKLKNGMEYAGPFYFYEEKLSAEEVVEKEAKTIEESDVCYFVLENDGNQPGTVVEIINATLRKKVVVILYVQKELNSGELKIPFNSPLWYPIVFAQKFNKENTTIIECNSITEAIAILKNKIGPK